MKEICLIVPSLKAGGMERIMAEIANYLSLDKKLKIHLILFDKEASFYEINEAVRIYRPQFIAKNRLSLIFKTHKYLRKLLKEIDPFSVLSFGSMYNSFVLLAVQGLNLKVFVSDRSNPYRNTKLTLKRDEIERHDGIHHYFLKKILYKRASGILVQTEKAKEIEYRYSGHDNIILFPNPIRKISEYPKIKKEKWILNVGRFISTKNQLMLIEIYSDLKIYKSGWQLVFAGEGPNLNNAKKYVEQLKLTDSIIFLGNVKDIDKYYRKSEIFALTSVSEGFPNALGEALKSSLACISFDCVAGPSDLIKNAENGFLIPLNDKYTYKKKLKLLVEDKDLRKDMQSKAYKSMDRFDRKEILKNLKEILINE